MKLLIGNKNYSSWSMRPWLVMTHFAMPFEEKMVPLSGDGWKENLVKLSPTGRVPVLIDGSLIIPETLAIIEYLADTHPHKPIWPGSTSSRARARAIASEMHAGFTALRSHAPMNLRASYPGRVNYDAVKGDVDRFEEIVSSSVRDSGGPYLFGEFSAADAMMAPLASRMRTYALPCSAVLKDYVDAIHELPAFKVWLTDALAETAVMEQDEIDFVQNKAP
jgi:glutathione S-transferase